MKTITERIQRKLEIQIKAKGHHVRTVVPDGWSTYEMRQIIDWEDGVVPERKLGEGVWVIEKPLATT
jgi:hypothetical protein